MKYAVTPINEEKSKTLVEFQADFLYLKACSARPVWRAAPRVSDRVGEASDRSRNDERYNMAYVSYKTVYLGWTNIGCLSQQAIREV